MQHANVISRLAALKRNTTVLELGAPSEAGGFSAAVIDGRLTLSAWDVDHEIIVELSASDLFSLRYFLNQIVDSAMTGSPLPEAFLRGQP